MICAFDEARCIVHWRHVDDERLRGAGVDATIEGAAAVLEVKRDRCRAVGVRCRGEREHTGGRHRRAGTEQGGVAVVGDVEGDGLPRFVGRTRRNRGGPRRDRLRTGVFKHGLIRTFGEARCYVNGRYRNDESLVGTRVETAIGNAAVVFQINGDGRCTRLIRGRGERERASRADSRACVKHRGVGIADDLEGNRLTGFVCATAGTDAGCPVGNRQCRSVLQHADIGTFDEHRRVVDAGNGDVESLRRRSIDAAIGRATVVLDVHTNGRRTAHVGGCGVGQHTGWAHGRRGAEQRGVAVGNNLEGNGLRCFAGGARADGRGPRRDRLRAQILKHDYIRALGKAWHLINRSDRDDEALVGAGINATVGGAAAVLEIDGDRCRAGLIARRGERERASRADSRACAEHRGVGIADDLEGNRLTGFVCRAGADRCRPWRHRLCRGVLQHADIGTFDEAWCIVDGGDVDDETLRGAGVNAAVCRAAVVLNAHADRRAAIGVGRWREGQVAVAAVDRWRCAE